MFKVKTTRNANVRLLNIKYIFKLKNHKFTLYLSLEIIDLFYI